MSNENKAICGRFHELFRTGDVRLGGGVLAEEVCWHTPALARYTGPGREGIIRFAEILRVGFPDLNFAITHTIAEGDRVAAAWQFTGTHSGTLAGMAGTGREVEMCGINILLIRDRLVRELWLNWNEAALYRQLDTVSVDVGSFSAPLRLRS